ncbi:MAG: AraC family transcriptional regulator [Pseudomonadota bacterium]
MKLDYFLPRPDMAEYVRAYYRFGTPGAAVQPLCAELGNIRIMLGGGGRIRLPGGAVETITKAFLIGPTMGAYAIECDAGTDVFGIGIKPRGWRALLGVDASETTNKVIDLTAFLGGKSVSVIDEITNARDLPSMAYAADRFLARLADKQKKRRCQYPEALEHWLVEPNDLDLDRLLAMMDVSQRQTDRLALKFFGASPKRLQRKYRSLRAADRIRNGVSHWRDAAGQSFYDQPHFIREFSGFIGVTPGQFMTKEAEIIREIQSRRIIRNKPLPLSAV